MTPYITCSRRLTDGSWHGSRQGCGAAELQQEQQGCRRKRVCAGHVCCGHGYLTTRLSEERRLQGRVKARRYRYLPGTFATWGNRFLVASQRAGQCAMDFTGSIQGTYKKRRLWALRVGVICSSRVTILVPPRLSWCQHGCCRQ